LTLKQQRFADEYIIEKKAGCVYCIENVLNGKRYVGITTRTIKERFAEHCKAESYIGKAIRKYGVENFKLYELVVANSREELCNLEVYYIEKYNTFKNGYNQTIGGDGVVKDIFIKVSLNEKQKQFVEFVNKENEKEINVDDANEMIRSCLLNIVQCYLICDSKIDKRKSAKMILKMKSVFLEKIFELNLFSINELRRWSEWRSTQNG
jgi:uncharacterized protein 019R